MPNGRRDAAAGKFLDWRSEVFPKRGRWSYFSHKREGLVKYGACFKNVGGIIYVHLTLSSVIFLWVLGVHVCCLFIYTISVSILCVWWEELSLIESNQQIYTFCNRYIPFVSDFWKAKTLWNSESKFFISANYSFNAYLVYSFMSVSIVAEYISNWQQ